MVLPNQSGTTKENRMLIHTTTGQWIKVRDQVTGNDTSMTASTKNFAARGTTKGRAIPLGANGVCIAFIGDNSAGDGGMEDDTAVATVYVYMQGGPAELVYTATITVGAQVAVEDPTQAVRASGIADTGYYCDTFGSATDSWATTVGTADAGGADGVAKLYFDCEGATWLVVEITSLDTGLYITPIFRYY